LPPPRSPSKKKKPLKRAVKRTASKKTKRPLSKPKKRAAQVLPKKKVARKPRKSKTTVRAPSVVKRARASFLKLRNAAIKAKKLVAPRFAKKKGKLALRGTMGKERSIVIAQFWEDIREGWLETQAMRSFASLLSEFDRPPTLYARFTFTVTKVNTLLTAGSPKLIRATRKRVKHWFFSTGLSYNLTGMRIQLERGFDTLNKTILEATRDNFDASFFLEYVTCIAYLVRE
jgi:hypothetical protein